MLLGIIGWIVAGLIVGFIGSKIVNLRGDDPRFGIGAAVAAALVGGIAYTVITGHSVVPWNPWSLMCAAIGGIVGMVAWHIVRSRSISHEGQTVRRSY